MKISPVSSLWLLTGIFFCFAQDEVTPVPVAPEPKQGVPQSLEAILPDLSHQDHSRRRSASQALFAWAKESRKESVAALLDLAAEAQAPEARERVLRVLREMAVAEYHEIGEGYCGIQMSQTSLMVDVPNRGMLASISLTFIADSGPAAKAGMKVNDAIVSVDEKVWKEPVNQMEELREIIRKKGAGTAIKLGVMRGGNYQEFTVQLHRRPPKIEQTNPTQQLFFGGGIQILPKIDQQYLDNLKKEDRESDDFFQEWLRKQKDLRKHK
jgi:predicted metalloprotease with PDZ domain